MLDSIRNSQVWNSIFRHGVPRDRRTRVMAIMSNIFLHLHPVAVRKSGIRLSFTWCMGGLTFFLFLAETITMPPGSPQPTKSRFEMILSVKEHEMHHRGQLMLIERMLDITPHLTRNMQARFAQQQQTAKS